MDYIVESVDFSFAEPSHPFFDDWYDDLIFPQKFNLELKIESGEYIYVSLTPLFDADGFLGWYVDLKTDFFISEDNYNKDKDLVKAFYEFTTNLPSFEDIISKITNKQVKKAIKEFEKETKRKYN